MDQPVLSPSLDDVPEVELLVELVVVGSVLRRKPPRVEEEDGVELEPLGLVPGHELDRAAGSEETLGVEDGALEVTSGFGEDVQAFGSVLDGAWVPGGLKCSGLPSVDGVVEVVTGKPLVAELLQELDEVGADVRADELDAAPGLDEVEGELKERGVVPADDGRVIGTSAEDQWSRNSTEPSLAHGAHFMCGTREWASLTTSCGQRKETERVNSLMEKVSLMACIPPRLAPRKP